MSSFTGNIKLEQLGKTDNCKVMRAFSFFSKRHCVLITVKRGFITDLASIPSFLRGIARGTANRYWRAFVIHDALYRKGYSKKKADNILDEALKILGMNLYERSKIYYPLRLFGSPTDDEELIQNASENISIETFELIQ
jgi:hypothetical protein